MQAVVRAAFVSLE